MKPNAILVSVRACVCSDVTVTDDDEAAVMPLQRRKIVQ